MVLCKWQQMTAQSELRVNILIILTHVSPAPIPAHSRPLPLTLRVRSLSDGYGVTRSSIVGHQDTDIVVGEGSKVTNGGLLHHTGDVPGHDIITAVAGLILNPDASQRARGRVVPGKVKGLLRPVCYLEVGGGARGDWGEGRGYTVVSMQYLF